MEAYVKASDLERLNIRLGRRLMRKEKAAIRASTFILVRRQFVLQNLANKSGGV